MKSTRPTPPPRLGVHVSIAGKLSGAVENAEALGCTAMQIFSRSPRMWSAKALDPDEVSRFRGLREKYDIKPAVIHASYLINLATPEGGLKRRSVEALIDELDRADRLGVEYLVVHVGSCKDGGAVEGVERVREALAAALSSGRWSTQLLLEDTAGERGDVGARLEEIGMILKGLPGGERVGVCLDTCHLFAAGYDITTPVGVERVAGWVERAIGQDRVKVVHGNDSKKGLNCRVDRHQHIGLGGIGLEGFRAWVNHPAFREIPMILETPKDTPEADPRNLITIKNLRRHERSE
ncbi:MAG: deoxyribonuclease IV [Nitrospirae bacterium]|nr:deoxyribonuclease IV [Nitrospirota bacterium]